MIQFPKLESWNDITKTAAIAATSDNKRVLCRISLEVLKDKFGASEEEPMNTVAKYRTDIQEVARKLIENETYEEDGSILIRARDL